MKHVITSITFAFTLAAAPCSNAALIPITRLSEIHGGGSVSPFDIPATTSNSTDLYAPFNETLVETSYPGWVENYFVTQQSSIASDGFSLSTAFSGDSTSGDFNGVGVYTHFTLGFYVDTPSVITVTASFLQTPHVALEVNLREWTRDGTSIGFPVQYLFTSGDTLPQSFQLDPQFAYVLAFDENDNISSAAGRPPFSANTQLHGVVSSVPEPTCVAILTLSGLAVVGLQRRCRRKGNVIQ